MNKSTRLNNVAGCRDIKLDNVLLVPNGDDKAAIPTVKLSDFG